MLGLVGAVLAMEVCCMWTRRCVGVVKASGSTDLVEGPTSR